MSAHVLVSTASTDEITAGIINISLPLLDPPSSTASAQAMLTPYLDATLTLTMPPSETERSLAAPLFTTFFIHNASQCTHSPDETSGIIVTPTYTQLLPAIADAATEKAEAMFWKAVGQLKAVGVGHAKTRNKEQVEDDVNGEEAPEEGAGDIDSFWPPLDAAEDETADEW